MSTGIFFHYQQGERLKDFPEVLGEILSRDNVFFLDAFYPSKPESSFDVNPVPLDVLLNVHSEEMVERVMDSGLYEGALYSASGTLSAATKIASGALNNAFVFTGFGDHHAGRDFFGGGCYFNGAAIAIHELKSTFQVQRFAIIDTDAHHGDGTWDLFQDDPNVLYLCFCAEQSRASHGNVNIHVPRRVDDTVYLELAKSAFEKTVKIFEPDIIFWNWGYDGTTGEYGDIGLTPEIHPSLALEIKRLSEEVCNGRLIGVLCGGSGPHLAALLIPGIIKILSGA